MNVMLRPGRDADADDILRIVDGCWSEYPGCVTDIDGEAPELRALATYCAGRDGAFWVAERSGTPVGMICAWPLADGAWELAKMYVQADARGSGAAHELAEAAEAHARAHGAVRMRLWSDTRFDRAHRFYEKRSYVRAGAIRALGDKSNSIEYPYAKPLAGVAVEVLDAAASASAVGPLARVLAACVDDGAAVSFLAPLDHAQARAFWDEQARTVARGDAAILAAWLDGDIVGTVSIIDAGKPNQPHRADLTKMLVTPRARRRGIGRVLMAAAEAEALRRGHRLLVLDTRAGGASEALYRQAGWVEVGAIPDYALNPDGQEFHATVYYYKRLVP
jgi:GNAT superfamily N-acetyltransferase